jgi:hypothetical protein
MMRHVLTIAPVRQYSSAWHVSTPHVKGAAGGGVVPDSFEGGIELLESFEDTPGEASMGVPESIEGVPGFPGVPTAASPSSKSGEGPAPLHPARLPSATTDAAKKSRPHRVREAI